MYYLTLGSLWKNENDYAIDFIKYHRKIGVEHFVIFNNADENDYSLEDLLKNEKDVEVIRFNPKVKQLHQEAWGKLIEYNQNKTKWLVLIDCDQALVPVKKSDVKEILKDYEEFACLQINWKSFGSSFQETRLPGSVYERFLYRAEADVIYNVHTQFICQPARTLGEKTPEPHYALFPEGEFSVNTNKERISADKIVELNPNTPLSFNVPPLYDVLYINHYTNKSKEEWLIKNNKGRADIIGEKIPSTQFDEYESVCNSVKDLDALKIWNYNKYLLELIKDKSKSLGAMLIAWENGYAESSIDIIRSLEQEIKDLSLELKKALND